MLSPSALIAALALASLPAAASATPYVCILTTFMRDNNFLTAAQVGGSVTGTLDATGCDIGVYYDSTFSGNVNGGAISGAKYFGVVVNGGQRDVIHSAVSNIGDTPFGGVPARHSDLLHGRVWFPYVGHRVG